MQDLEGSDLISLVQSRHNSPLSTTLCLTRKGWAQFAFQQRGSNCNAEIAQIYGHKLIKRVKHFLLGLVHSGSLQLVSLARGEWFFNLDRCSSRNVFNESLMQPTSLSMNKIINLSILNFQRRVFSWESRLCLSILMASLSINPKLQQWLRFSEVADKSAQVNLSQFK